MAEEEGGVEMGVEIGLCRNFAEGMVSNLREALFLSNYRISD